MSVGWLVGRLVDVTIKFFIHSDPVPPNTSQYRPILTQYHHISLSLNVPRDNVPCNKFPRDNGPCDQGGITCGAIDEPRKSSKAIDKRVIIDFCTMGQH